MKGNTSRRKYKNAFLFHFSNMLCIVLRSEIGTSETLQKIFNFELNFINVMSVWLFLIDNKELRGTNCYNGRTEKAFCKGHLESKKILLEFLSTILLCGRFNSYLVEHKASFPFLSLWINPPMRWNSRCWNSKTTIFYLSIYLSIFIQQSLCFSFNKFKWQYH